MATFAALVSKVQNKLNLTSTESATRIGEEINDRYKRITSSLGINVVRRGTIGPIAITLGLTTVVFTGCEKIVNVQYRGVTPYKILDEVTIEELRVAQPSSLTLPTCYAIVDFDATTVTIEMDCIPQSAFDLYADGFANLSTLSGVQVPAFSESFHDILEHGALADEYTKMDKVAQAREAEAKYERRLSDLRMWIAKSSYANIRQGKTRETLGSAGAPGAGGGSSSINGATSYTQTGLITFSRAGQAPFAVVVGSLVVANLNADLLDGLDSTAFRLVSVSILETDFGFTDITTADVTSTKHGLAPKSPADATKFLNGAATPAYAQVKDSDLSTSDIVTNNVVSTKHGFAPKSPALSGQFLNGAATPAWAYPAYTVVTSSTTSNQNNWAPGLAGHTEIIWSGVSDIIVTGFAGGVTGQIIIFKNTGTAVATFSHNSGSSSAGNKLFNHATSGGTPVAAGGYVAYQFDGTQWQIIGHEQGAWITPTFAAGAFVGAGGTWTVAAGDVTTMRYRLSGRAITLVFSLATTSTGVGTITQLTIANTQWGGFTGAAFLQIGSANAQDSGAALTGGYSQLDSSGTAVRLLRHSGTAWTASVTDNTGVYGTATFEVT